MYRIGLDRTPCFMRRDQRILVVGFSNKNKGKKGRLQGLLPKNLCREILMSRYMAMVTFYEDDILSFFSVFSGYHST
jgi:hypothetical protein